MPALTHLFAEINQNARFAVRSLARARLYAVTVVGTMGVAVGLTAAAGTVFDAYLVRTLPVRQPERLYSLTWRDRRGADHQLTWPQFVTASTRRDVFTAVAAERFVFARVEGVPSYGRAVSGNYFQMLGVHAAVGRLFNPADDDGGSSSIVLNHTFWQNHFAADSLVIGKRVAVKGLPFLVVGVAEEGFGGLNDTPMDFWVPSSALSTLGQVDRQPPHDMELFDLVGHLNQGISAAQAASALTAWLRSQSRGDSDGLYTARATLVSRARPMTLSPQLVLAVMPVAVAFALVLLGACANIGNMVLARNISRGREIAARLALGAGRGRIIRQLLTEAIVLAIPAAAIAFAFSRLLVGAGVRWLFATAPADFLPYLRFHQLGADGRIVAFTLVLTMASAILFAWPPALRATRDAALRGLSGGVTESLHESRLRSALLITQVTVCVLLLVCVGVLVNAARTVRAAPVGYRTARLLAVELNRPLDRSGVQLLAANSVQNIVASAMAAPLSGALPRKVFRTENGRLFTASFNVVSPSFFQVLGIRILNGRNFLENEGGDKAPVAIVSASTARRFWPTTPAIGHSISVVTDSGPRAPRDRLSTVQIVGVVPDVLFGFVGTGPDPALVYYPRRTDSATSYVLPMRNAEDVTRHNIEASLATLRPNPLSEMHTLQSALAVQAYPFSLAYQAACVLGVVALLLTLTGIYSVLAYAVAQRRTEIAIRLAIGASSVTAVWTVLRRVMTLSGFGILLGCALAVVLTKAMASASSRALVVLEPVTYIASIGLIALAIVVAAYIPARDASNVDPMNALRGDA